MFLGTCSLAVGLLRSAAWKGYWWEPRANNLSPLVCLWTGTSCPRSALNLTARVSSLLREQMHLTSDGALLEATHGKRDSEIWQTLYGEAVPQSCLQPLGWTAARKANDSRLSPSVEACTELEQAQLRKEKLLSQHNAVMRDKILLKAYRSTHDFRNFLGVKRELRMETNRGMETWSVTVCILSKCKSKLDSTRHCSELCSIEEAGEESVCGSFLRLGGAKWKEGQNRGLLGYFQPWLSLFVLLVEMGIWGTTPALVSWKQVTSRGQGGQAPCDVGQQGEVWQTLNMGLQLLADLGYPSKLLFILF